MTGRRIAQTALATALAAAFFFLAATAETFGTFLFFFVVFAAWTWLAVDAAFTRRASTCACGHTQIQHDDWLTGPCACPEHSR